MLRSLYLNCSSPIVQREKLEVITSNRQAARGLQVRYQTLNSIAETIIRSQGFKVASPLIASRLLRRSVSLNINTNDVEGIARCFTPSLKVFLRARVNLNTLQHSLSPRIQQLAKVAITYQQLLEEKNCVDSAALLWKAIEFQPTAKPYLFYGYFHPRLDELSFINAIAGNGSIFVLPCNNDDIFANNQQAKEFLEEQNWQILTPQETSSFGKILQERFLKDSTTTEVSSNVQLHTYPTVEAEVRGVLAQIKDLLSQGVAPNQIAVVARDERFYGTFLIDTAWEYQLPIRASYQVSLQETRIGAWLKLLLEVVQTDFPFETTARLLSHSLAGKLTPELWKKARQQHPQGYEEWTKLGIDLALLKFPQQDRRDEWVERLFNILKFFELRQQAKGWAKELVALSTVETALVELSKPESDRISQSNFIQDILETLALLTVPAQPGRGGIELHTPVSLFGANYSHLFVLGMAEGILPAPIENDPILDFYERKQLNQSGFNLETAAQAAQREALSFYTLLHVPTARITFSYPRLKGKDALLPSPYLLRLGLTPSDVPTLPLASLEEARRLYLRQNKEELVDSVLERAYHSWTVEQRRESASSHDEYDGVVSFSIDFQTREFSASQLTQLGQCPFKWFSGYVLRLKKLPEAELDLNSSLRGQLYHRCLELALSEIKTPADLVKIQHQELTEAFLQAETDIETKTGITMSSFPAWEGRRREHLETLFPNFSQSDFLPNDHQVVALETQFKANWYGLTVTGIIDRLDRNSEGLMIIDYKTSSTSPPGIKNEQGEAKINIQLPIYMAGISDTFPNESVNKAVYYSITKHQVIQKSSGEDEKMAAFANQVKQHLEAGFYPVDPDVKEKACQYCRFDLVCRRGSRLTRKRFNQERE